jgi:imidazolonepropionase-like amidohydrolase
MRAHGLARLAILLSLVSPIGTSSATVQSRVIAFTGVTLIDGTDAAPRADLTVLIEGNQISAIGKTGAVRVPADAQRVDGRAKFLIPGLWDMHVHLGAYDGAAKALPRFVAYGITGVRDMASPVDDIVRLRRDSAGGTLLGPQILAAGPILQRPLPFRLPPFVRTVTDADARSAVDELHENGVDFIKVGDTLTRNAYFAIAEQSTRRGLPFAGHLPVSVSAAEAAHAGQRSIEHFGSAGFRGVLLACSRDEARLTEVVRDALTTALAGGPSPDEKLYQAEFLNALVDSYDNRKAAALFELFTTNRTWQEPTLVALRDVWEQQRTRLKFLEAAAGDRVWTKTLEMFADMRVHGVKVLAGSDVPVGLGVPPLHDELVALVGAGMTPLQALQTATRNAADFQGRLATEGTVEVGKKANLVLLEADPLRDIANTRRVAAVVVGGRFVSESELQKIR